MMTKRFFAFIGSLLMASCCQATICASIELVSSGNNDLLGGGQFDLYHVMIDNQVGDATSAEFAFPGMFFTGTGSTFRDTTDLAAPNLADSFIVLPSGTTPLAALQVDTSTLLQVAYTVSGTTPVVPLGVSTIAVLSVPAGFALDLDGFSGSVVIGGESMLVSCIPEPSAALLVGLALAGFAARRGR